MNKVNARQIFFLWLTWAIILLSFQKFLNARIPNNVFNSPGDTAETEPYLSEPYLNETVAWDSEYYLSIPLAGYDDPKVGFVQINGVSSTISKNYARFPLYPALIYLLSKPLTILGLNPIATATLAGVIISLIGTLAAMFALYDFALPGLGEDGAFRSIFYLLIYPTGFYLAQVYAEGLFIGCAFSALALMRHANKGDRFMWYASILALLATWTRAVGVSLAFALVISQVEQSGWKFNERTTIKAWFSEIPWKSILNGLKFSALPIVGYLAWAFSPLGERFQFVMKNFFGNRTLGILPTFVQWITVLQVMAGRISMPMPDPANTIAYYLLQIFTLIMALVAGIRVFKTQVTVAIFSLASLAMCLFTSLPYGFPRYTLAIPATFIFLSELGKSKTFDRAWIIGSLLLMGLMVTLYTLNLWVD